MSSCVGVTNRITLAANQTTLIYSLLYTIVNYDNVYIHYCYLVIYTFTSAKIKMCVCTVQLYNYQCLILNYVAINLLEGDECSDD